MAVTRETELAEIDAAIRAGKLRRLPTLTPAEALDREIAAVQQRRTEARRNPVRRRGRSRKVWQ